MIKRFKLFFLFIFLVNAVISQTVNLVPNPGFEDSIPCQQVSGTFRPKKWFSPTNGTPDYFLEASAGNWGCLDSFPDRWGGGGFTNNWGYQVPHTGSCYTGFGVFLGAEYIETKLSDSLRTGKKYHISFYTSLANVSRSGLDLIQISFTNQNITAYDTINGTVYFLDAFEDDASSTPGVYLLDTANWMYIADTITAIGGEQFLTVGNHDTANTQYYLVDSVNPARFAYYYFDDFDLHCIDCDTTMPPEPPPTYPEIKIYPIPSNDGVFTIEYELGNGGYMEIHNALGQLVGTISLETGAHLKTLSLISLAGGVYHYRVMADGVEQKAGKMVISK